MIETAPIQTIPIRILLVDDVPLFRNMLSTFLSKYPGFEIFEAENGKTVSDFPGPQIEPGWQN